MFRRKDKREDDFDREALVHLDSLYNGALYMTRDEQEAQDLVQETMLKAYRFFDQYERGTNCRAWLFRIMNNTFINRNRKKGRSVRLVDMVDFSEREDRYVPDDPLANAPDGPNTVGTAAPNPEAAVAIGRLREEIEKVLETLPDEFRVAVILCDLQGFSYKEIAEIMGCPVGTVMSRIFRGRKLLKARLKQFVEAEGYVSGPDARQPVSLDEYRRRQSARQGDKQ